MGQCIIVYILAILMRMCDLPYGLIHNFLTVSSVKQHFIHTHWSLPENHRGYCVVSGWLQALDGLLAEKDWSSAQRRCGGLSCIPGSFYLAYHRLRWSLSSSVGPPYLKDHLSHGKGVVRRLNPVTCYSQKQWERVSKEMQLIADISSRI